MVIIARKDEAEVRYLRVLSPLIAVALVVFIGRWLSTPDPSGRLYWTWLSWSGVALGIVNGVWAGSLCKEAAIGGTAGLAGAAMASGVALLQVLIYALLLPDALMLTPGQVPQDNLAAWLLGGIGLIPSALLTGVVCGWWYGRRI